MAVFGAVGSQLTFWQYRNSSGYGVGTNNAMTNGQNSGAGRLYGITTGLLWLLAATKLHGLSTGATASWRKADRAVPLTPRHQ